MAISYKTKKAAFESARELSKSHNTFSVYKQNGLYLVINGASRAHGPLIADFMNGRQTYDHAIGRFERMKQNPAKPRVVRKSTFYDRSKYPYEILAKDHPLGNHMRYGSEKEAREAAKRLANYYGVPVRVTVKDTREEQVYSKNPRGRGGIGYYSFTHPETGEKIVDSDLATVKRIARKLANRLGRAIQVREDYSGKVR